MSLFLCIASGTLMNMKEEKKSRATEQFHFGSLSEMLNVTGITQYASISRFDKRTVRKWEKSGKIPSLNDIKDGRERVLNSIWWSESLQAWAIDLDMTRYAKKLEWVFQCDGTQYLNLSERGQKYDIYSGRVADIPKNKSYQHLIVQILFDFWGTDKILVHIHKQGQLEKLSDWKLIIS